MPRYRRFPTNVRSERDLARALGEMGIKNVEVHPEARALADWIGRPTDVRAEVIVRRKDLGASFDDLGFVRTSQGTFEMLASDIHLFRFDRRFLEELARRTGTGSAPSGPVQFATPSAPASVHAHARSAGESAPPPPAREQNLEQRARIEVSELVESARRGQRLGRVGCLLFFLPVLPWLLMEQSERTRTGLGGLVSLMAVWGGMYFVGLSIVLTIRLGRMARRFQARFSSRDARAAATAELRSIAEAKREASETARRLLREVERQGRRAVMPHPPTGTRAGGGTARR